MNIVDTVDSFQASVTLRKECKPLAVTTIITSQSFRVHVLLRLRGTSKVYGPCIVPGNVEVDSGQAPVGCRCEVTESL